MRVLDYTGQCYNKFQAVNYNSCKIICGVNLAWARLMFGPIPSCSKEHWLQEWARLLF